MSQEDNFVESTKVDDKYDQHNQTDLYSVLQLDKDATEDQIKEKYNELLLLYHPDKGGDPQKFKDLKAAYKILSDPKKREVYNKSLSSTFDDITQEYRDAETGKIKDIGYERAEDDFTRVELTEEEKAGLSAKEIKQLIEKKKDEQQQKFMDDFEKSRTAEEKQFMDDLKKSVKPEMTFEELKKQRELDEEDLAIPMTIDPKNFNADVFNQMFDAVKQSSRKDLEPMGNPSGWGATGLAPLDNAFGGGSMFGNDPWASHQQQLDFGAYAAPTHMDPSQFSADTNVTRTRDNNEGDLDLLLKRRMEEHLKDRDELMFMDKGEYQIAPEHDPKLNPLSVENMLGSDFVQGTLDPPKEKKDELSE
jgi:curved DNA-binding protein CbpA